MTLSRYWVIALPHHDVDYLDARGPKNRPVRLEVLGGNTKSHPGMLYPDSVVFSLHQPDYLLDAD